jgi:hypothetical protein
MLPHRIQSRSRGSLSLDRSCDLSRITWRPIALHRIFTCLFDPFTYPERMAKGAACACFNAARVGGLIQCMCTRIRFTGSHFSCTPFFLLLERYLFRPYLPTRSPITHLSEVPKLPRLSAMEDTTIVKFPPVHKARLYGCC